MISAKNAMTLSRAVSISFLEHPMKLERVFHVLCDSGTITIVQFLKSRYWEIHKYKEGGK